jgi:hypothetical protein
MRRVYSEASAPTRIDLAGGTLDISLLYLGRKGCGAGRGGCLFCIGDPAQVPAEVR